jgi:hypothetical protein
VFENVALDLRVRIPDNLVVRGRRLRPGGPTGAALGDLNITLGGDLNVRKETGGPVTLAGTVNTVRGTYRFQNRQFDLARDGTIRFTGDAEFNPVLDVTATREIPDTGVEAKVRVTGSLRAPELALSSTPPLEESDVAPRFNCRITELAPASRVAAATAGDWHGFIATPLGESTGRRRLDIFEITTNTDGAPAPITATRSATTFFCCARVRRVPDEEFMEYQLRTSCDSRNGAPETSGANRLASAASSARDSI